MAWAIAFHLFWEGAKLVAQQIQVLLFHMDEKWFMSLVLRMHNKIAPFFGCHGVWNRIHHKKSIDKLLAIAVVGITPFENDLRKGGKAHKICLTRCGGMVKAKQDSYKRVYNQDGTYHYPKILENLLRKKGNEYFENWEITGSTNAKATGEGKKKKVSSHLPCGFLSSSFRNCWRSSSA